MQNVLKNSRAVLMIVVVALGLSFTACGGVSEEEMAQLEALRSEVRSLSNEVDQLKAEKTKLEREIAERNAKLEECKKAQEATKANLEKIK
jgi:septal ring factor EnvC (AmiA/AmiB activator)